MVHKIDLNCHIKLTIHNGDNINSKFYKLKSINHAKKKHLPYSGTSNFSFRLL